MAQPSSISSGPLRYAGPQPADGGERVLVIGAVLLLHGAVVGALAFAQLHPPAPPPETVLTVSFVSEGAATAAASPAPPPPPPPPEETLVAAPRSASPMSAPPPEEPAPQLRPAPAQPVLAAPAPPSPAVAPVAQATAPGASAGPTEGSITPPSFSADYLRNPGPQYPIGSRRRREQGLVRLRVHVSPDGAPDQVQLQQSSGYPDLDKAALDVVQKRWRFAPAKQAGQAVAAWVIVPVEFSLKDR